jgi:hypothetical protein
MDNISVGDMFVDDVATTLDRIEHLPWCYTHGKHVMFRASCIPQDTDSEEIRHRMSAKTRCQWQSWLNTYSAPEIARNAFDLGWELRMRAITSDYAAEVVQRKPRNYHMMCSFLNTIDTCIEEMQQREQDVNEAAAIAMQRWGIDTEVCRMILPGKTRFMGIPLAMLPRYMALPR